MEILAALPENLALRRLACLGLLDRVETMENNYAEMLRRLDDLGKRTSDLEDKKVIMQDKMVKLIKRRIMWKRSRSQG